MPQAILLTVTDSFQIEGKGLILSPDFSIPAGGWKHHAEEVTVATPSGESFVALAHFDPTHFKFSDLKASMDQRARVVVVFPDKSKHEIPIGSSIWASSNLREELGKNAEQDGPPNDPQRGSFEGGRV